eukprot:c23824_g2_i5 orf=476-1762(-)
MTGSLKKVGRYELGRTLGEGTFAKVKYARNTDTGEVVAIKIIDKEKILKRKMIKREISTMKLIKHPNVVQLFEVIASRKYVYIVMEYVNGGELFDKIVDQGKLREDQARKYFRQLIHAVDYCHSRGVYHRDLKPENMLLDSNSDLKVSDFGLSALSQQRQDDGLFHTICGTPNYVAPEVINEKGYDGARADLWSCGIILYVLLAGFLPFDESNLITLYRKIDQADFSFPSWFSVGAKKLITRILDPNPEARITVPEVLEDEWFKFGYSPMECFDKDVDADEIDATVSTPEVREDIRPALINAFDIISMSQGLDLSGLFKEREVLLKSETRFSSTHPAKVIMSKIEDFASSLGISVRRKNYKMKLQSTRPGRKGCLSMAAEVFEVGPSLFMVDMKKTSGDTLEYSDFHKDLRVGLKDIVWKTEDDFAGL